MKLIFCPGCRDIVRLFEGEKRFCKCKDIWGIYTDDLNALISKRVIPLGIGNRSFVFSLKHRPKEGMGERFEAFVIPKDCPTIKVEE